MSRDYLVERIKTERLHSIVKQLGGHHDSYALRVEKIVEDVMSVKIEHLKLRSRKRVLAHARYVLFAILWQKRGHRSTGWLSLRYNIDPWSVFHGINRVHEDDELRRKYITVMTILERQLTLELFGEPTVESGISFDILVDRLLAAKGARPETRVTDAPVDLFDTTI